MWQPTDKARSGIELAIEEINAAGGINGKQIELVKYDNKSQGGRSYYLNHQAHD